MADFDDQLRYGGPQADDDAERKAQEREAKKAEVRKRLEEAGNKKKAKKGFLTPERKKKLRKLLMMKAAEDLKQQQLLKEQERQRILKERTIPMPDVDSINDQGKLLQIYNDLFGKLRELEESKYDINVLVGKTESEINELTIAVNDLRGKFVKPALKKVSKYENKFKMGGAGAPGGEKADFRANLKVVKKETNVDELLSKGKKKDDKPDWSKKPEKAEEKKEEKEPEEAAPPAAEPKPEPEPEPVAEEEGGEEEGEEEEEEEE